jgi:hypothetical protein
LSPADKVTTAVSEIAAAGAWNRRVALIRKIPEEFGKAQHQAIYAAVAETVYVPNLTPDFAYIHWRDEYELPAVQDAYEKARVLTRDFTDVGLKALTLTIQAEPVTLRIFRLLLGFTSQEFAASTAITAETLTANPLAASTVKAMENGGACKSRSVAEVAAAVVDQAMRGVLFTGGTEEVRSKLDKPDTVGRWKTVMKYATEGVPFPVFLHQRHYGGAFRQLLDATSGKRGDLLEQAVEDLFTENGILFVLTTTIGEAPNGEVCCREVAPRGLRCRT